MDRRVPLVVAVALLTSLSGCSVILGGDGRGPATPERTVGVEVTVDAPGSSTATPSGPVRTAGQSTPTATPVVDRGYETFDAARLNADHAAALEGAGSFTRQSTLVVRNRSATRYVNGTYAVERGGPAANTVNITYVTDGGVEDLPPTTRYTADGETYERQVERTATGTEVSYRSGAAPYGTTDPTPVDRTVAYSLGRIARDVVEGSEWNRTGTGRVGGVEATRYDAADERFGVSGAPDADGAATLVVDEDGVVRYVACRFVVETGGERTEYVYEAAYTDVGSRTVEEPAWTDRA
jgi:hypothetical protein